MTREQPYFNPARLPEYPDYFDVLGKRLPSPQNKFDAVVVPSARGAESLTEVASLCEVAEQPLVVLCSMDTKATEVADMLDEKYGATPWYTVDVPTDYQHELFAFKAPAEIPEACRVPGDLARKRNIGLTLGQLIFYLDDDIKISKAALDDAHGSLAAHTIVGFGTAGEPDMSVLHRVLEKVRRRHIYKYPASYKTRGASNISGNSLGVKAITARGHFPEQVYNEDWLMIYEDLLPLSENKVVLSKHTSHQKRYDPFASPERAVREEFGDIIAEGLYQNLQSGLPVRYTAEHTFWKNAILARRALIETVLEALDAPINPKDRNLLSVDQYGEVQVDRSGDDKVRASLQAMLAVNETITPSDCLTYASALKWDQAEWRKRKRRMAAANSITERLRQLDLASNTLSNVAV